MIRLHMARSMIRSVGRRGARAITSSISGSTPMARAGPESVTRLIHRIWVASSGTTVAAGSAGSARPMTPASTTPRNTVAISPMFELSR